MLIIRPQAEADLQRAYSWYEGKREGLGDAFLSCADSAVERIERLPEQCPVVYRNVRRVLLRRFPYGIFSFTIQTTSL